MNKYFLSLSSLLLIVGAISCTPDAGKKKQDRFDYIFDMVHDNPGDSLPTVTKYKDPEYLESQGFNGMVINSQIQSVIFYDSFEKGIIPEGSKEREWIQHKRETLKAVLGKAEDAGMPVYAFTDILVIPTIILEKDKEKIVGDTKKGKALPDINKELTQKLIRVQVDEIFDSFPELDGLVIRFGETYLFQTPHHSGGSPVRTGQEGIDGHVKLINLLRDEVCVKRNKKLFYRTWDFGNFFHVNPEVYMAISNQIEPHENLIFSIKHVKGDFRRNTVFNPTLGIGKHQQIVEVQCQREYEGKGAHPDYIAKPVIEGFEEYDYLMKPGPPKCLNDLLDNPLIKGVWTWSRGGGWRGPYIQNELWVDLNTFVMAQWTQNPKRSEEDIFNEFAEETGVDNEDIPAFRKLCLLSTKGVLRGRVSKYGNVHNTWIRDQYINGLSKLEPFFKKVISDNLVEEVIAEKEEALKIWREMEKLTGTIHIQDPETNEFLRISTQYGRIKYEIVANGWKALLLGMKGDQEGKYDKERIEAAIKRYDELWVEWKNLKASSLLCPTLYLPDGFKMSKTEGVSGRKETGIGASIDKYRNI